MKCGLEVVGRGGCQLLMVSQERCTRDTEGWVIGGPGQGGRQCGPEQKGT